MARNKIDNTLVRKSFAHRNKRRGREGIQIVKKEENFLSLELQSQLKGTAKEFQRSSIFEKMKGNLGLEADSEAFNSPSTTERVTRVSNYGFKPDQKEIERSR